MKLTIEISESLYKRIENQCDKSRRTDPQKFIRTAISDFADKHEAEAADRRERASRPLRIVK
jgi:predicted transcriptional regulator